MSLSISAYLRVAAPASELTITLLDGKRHDYVSHWIAQPVGDDSNKRTGKLCSDQTLLSVAGRYVDLSGLTGGR
jgi:hypothetical protein